MTKDGKFHHGNTWMPVMYANYYGILKEVAERHGYALAIHGTLTRDMDLIAVAWIPRPKSYLKMLKAMRKALGTQRIDKKPYDSIENKPHGRIGFTINTGGGGYVDISIIPPCR